MAIAIRYAKLEELASLLSCGMPETGTAKRQVMKLGSARDARLPPRTHASVSLTDKLTVFSFDNECPHISAPSTDRFFGLRWAEGTDR